MSGRWRRLRRWCLSAALLGVACGALAQEPEPAATTEPSQAAQASEPQVEHSRPADERGSTDQRGTEAIPLIVKTLPAPKGEEERAQEAHDREEKANSDRDLADYTRWLAIFTGALAIATVALVIATGLLGFFAWRQARDTRKSIAISQDAVRAVVENERPWVGPETVSCEPFEPLAQIKAGVTIKNTGRAPAREMKAAFEGHILLHRERPNTPEVSCIAPKALFPSIPDYYHPFYRYNLAADVYQDLLAGRKCAWIIGRVEYLGVNGEFRWTNVTTKWNPIARAGGAFVPDERGNDAI